MLFNLVNYCNIAEIFSGLPLNISKHDVKIRKPGTCRAFIYFRLFSAFAYICGYPLAS